MKPWLWCHGGGLRSHKDTGAVLDEFLQDGPGGAVVVHIQLIQKTDGAEHGSGVCC